MANGVTWNGGRRYRRRWRAGDRRAVVSVVGTLLALLVFFALFGIFVTQYVPLWMNDNESAWTAQVQEALAQLKSNMDLQVALGNPPLLSTPVVMASQAIPLIAQPTAGVLSFTPQLAGVFANVSMTAGPGNSGPFYQNFSLGTLRLQLPNRYYAPQTFELENDAVVQSQSDIHQILAFPPPIAFNSSGGHVGVVIGMYQMIGNASQAVSTGTEQIYSHYISTQNYISHGIAGATFNAKFVMGTHYECGWQAFLKGLLQSSGLPIGMATLTPSTCSASLTKAQDVTLSLTGISSLQLIVANFEIVIGVGVE
jgi:hypothetical protein